MSEETIVAAAKTNHDALSDAYYALSPTEQETRRAEFNQQHGQVWDDLEISLIAAGYRQPPKPQRDLAGEIDTLKAEIELLKRR